MNDPATVRAAAAAASRAGRTSASAGRRTSTRAARRTGSRRRPPGGTGTRCRRVLTSRPSALQPRRHDVAGGEERRPDDRRTDRPRRLRVAGPRRLEQIGLVAEAEHPVVVHEIDVAVERQRAQVGEVVEAVALEPGAELQLRREPAAEQQRQEDEDVAAHHGHAAAGARAAMTPDSRRAAATVTRCERGQWFQPSSAGEERPPRDLSAGEVQSDGGYHQPSGARDCAGCRLHRRAMRRTFRILSSGPGWSATP